MDKQVQSNSEMKAEQREVHNMLRRRVLDEIVYTAADSLLAHGVSFKEFQEVIIPRLTEVFQIFQEYENRHKDQEAEEWHMRMVAAERDAAVEKGEVIAWSARNIL